jgi:hypothetical protein
METKVFDRNAFGSGQPQKPNKLTLRNLTPEQKKILVGTGAVGSGLLSGAAIFSFFGFTSNQQQNEPVQVPENVEGDETLDIYSTAPIDNRNLDDLSFKDAFTSAREAIGQGGFFEWRGQYYNTYYAEEWAAMSQEERDLFADSLSNNPEFLNEPAPAERVVSEQPSTEYEIAEITEVQVVSNQTGQGAAESGSAYELDLNADGIIDAIGIDSDNSGVLDILAIDSNGDDVIDTYIIDSDGDELFDIVLVDEAQDGISQDDVIYSLEEERQFSLSVDDIDQTQNAAVEGLSGNDDLPEIDDSADISDFI